jgi:uncharacterized SAM-binding protein YcdF (DUF218 family)
MEKLRIILRRCFLAAGILLLLQFIFALTGPPQSLTDWLNAESLRPTENPKYVIVLGGGGIPSGSSLIRTYYAAQYGLTVTGATFIVSLPADESPDKNSVGRMRNELIMRGIPAASIRMEYRGLNTYQQAQGIVRMLPSEAFRQPVVLVSSEFHLRRAVLIFRKTGFMNVAAINAGGIDAEAWPGPLAFLRYGVWENAAKNFKITRELIALLGCKICGWI